MPKPMIRIHDLTSDTIEDREMTTAEFSQYQKNQLKLKTEQDEVQANADAKVAILDRLGLTADELKTILG